MRKSTSTPPTPFSLFNSPSPPFLSVLLSCEGDQRVESYVYRVGRQAEGREKRGLSCSETNPRIHAKKSREASYCKAQSTQVLMLPTMLPTSESECRRERCFFWQDGRGRLMGSGRNLSGLPPPSPLHSFFLLPFYRKRRGLGFFL